MDHAIPRAYRYAVYLAPAAPFWRVGNQWLGRCPEGGAQMALPQDADPRHAEWVGDPAHYGLHATLKAPFRLAEDATPAALDAHARAFAMGRQAFSVPLALRNLRGFLAWCMDEGDAAAEGRAQMQALAGDAVRGFDAFRAPPSAAELARRKPERLGPAERAMLERWGYPYAFDTFLFHITLSGMLDADTSREVASRIEQASGHLMLTPLQVASISLYVQTEPGADFLVARHYGFDGSHADGAGVAWLGGSA
jgi:hypothetical protein